MYLTWNHWCFEWVSFDEIEVENIQSGLICSGDFLLAGYGRGDRVFTCGYLVKQRYGYYQQLLICLGAFIWSDLVGEEGFDVCVRCVDDAYKGEANGF